MVVGVGFRFPAARVVGTQPKAAGLQSEGTQVVIASDAPQRIAPSRYSELMADSSSTPATFETRYSVVSRVLVVEDDPLQQDFYRSTLGRAGMSVEVAKDGGQAHAMFTMHKPDFVVLDLILPGESGYEVCRRIKRTEKTMPVLIVSEVSLDDSRSLAARVGADDYRTKPIAGPELVEAIHHVGETVWRQHHLGGEKPKQQHERIRFACGSCEKKIKVRASHAGQPLACPECGHINSVPRVG